ncbi:hypothetical protein BSKO_01007 [Bryopsis sp. KO-2023]|nr:hypothetical protein BSKO_01007 [Bryopsis sp. KO-2023]
MSNFHPSYFQMLGVGQVPYKEGVLLHFKAGKMTLVEKKLKSDPRRGVVRVFRDAEDLVHVQWFERDSAMKTKDAPEDDVLVLPGESTFKRVGSTTQRVYVLQFPEDPSRDMFFWMQESVIDTDAELGRQMNKVLNHPEEVQPSPSMSREGEQPGRMSTASAQGASTPSPAQLAQLLSAISSGQGASDPRQQATVAASLLAAACGVPLNGNPQQIAGPSLGEILKPEILYSYLTDPDMLEKLASHLPEEHRNQEALLELAQSPQFLQQLKTFGMALQTGQLDLATLGIRAEGFSVVDFLKGVQDLVEREKKDSTPDASKGIE